jgi:hypothetical protein
VTPESELARTKSRPEMEPSGPLAAFYVEVASWDESDRFAQRVRELVRAGIQVSATCDFEADDLPETGLPAWTNEAGFLQQQNNAKLRYSLHRGDESWTMQDLLFSFDPRQRSWEWWDITQISANVVQIWVDSRGEPVFACDELRWICYLSGARSLVGPLLMPSEAWESVPPIGIVPDSTGVI